MRVVPGLVLLSIACSDGDQVVVPPNDDLAAAFVDDAAFRRRVLERDLIDQDNTYAEARLANYGLGDAGWDVLPVRDPVSGPLTVDDTDALAVGADLELVGGERLSARIGELSWEELGRQVFFAYPFTVGGGLEAAARAGVLDEVGLKQADGVWVGLRKVREGGQVRIGPTCALCHGSLDEAGAPTAVRANRDLDLAAIHALGAGLPGDLDNPVGRLAPGHSDVLGDGVHNPYAFPDLGGIVDMPWLHHNANWWHTGTETLAVRVDTLFVTGAQGTRIDRELAWAIAAFLRSLPASAPLRESHPLAARGEAVFGAAGCSGCHVPPLYTTTRRIPVEEVGTDPSAALSPARFSGHYRVPSLRGVGRHAPYLHHGAFDTLDAMFDPERTEPGHPWGLDLSEADREALIGFLETL